MADAVGYRAGYLLGIGLCVAALAVMWRGYREDEGERPAEEAGAGISLREAPSVPGLLSLLALAFLVAALIPGLGPLLPIQLQRLAGEGAPVATLSGAALALGNVAASGAALSLGRASRRWPSGRLLAASFVAGGAATALVPAIPAVGAAFGLWVARSGLTGAVVPLLYGAADVHLPPRAREAVYPSLTAAMMVGYAAGPLFAGLLGLVDLGGAFVAVGVMLMGLGLWAARAFAPESRLA